MNARENVLAEFQKKPENTLIITSELYRKKFSSEMKEAAFAKAEESSAFQKGYTAVLKKLVSDLSSRQNARF